MEVLTKLIAAGFVTTCVCALIGMFINTVFYFVGLVIVAVPPAITGEKSFQGSPACPNLGL